MWVTVLQWILCYQMMIIARNNDDTMRNDSRIDMHHSFPQCIPKIQILIRKFLECTLVLVKNAFCNHGMCHIPFFLDQAKSSTVFRLFLIQPHSRLRWTKFVHLENVNLTWPASSLPGQWRVVHPLSHRSLNNTTRTTLKIVLLIYSMNMMIQNVAAKAIYLYIF